MFALCHCLVMSKEQFYDKFLYDELVEILHIAKPMYPHGLHRMLLIIEHNQCHIPILECPINLNNTTKNNKQKCHENIKTNWDK